MNPDIVLIERLRGISKLYDMLCREVCMAYGITKTELDVLAFLSNNPGRDTASDIVEYRMLPKANVSQAVDSLIKKGWLTRNTDEKDRRRIHLGITAASDMVCAIHKMQERMQSICFREFSEEEMECHEQMMQKIYENCKAAMESAKLQKHEVQ